jgi:putative aldouronate transport system substrate-binding protein
MLRDSSGKINNRMNTYTAYFDVVRKGYEHPEAIIKMNNVILRDASKLDNNINIAIMPLHITLSSADDVQLTYHALMDVLNGKAKPEDFNTEKYTINYLLKGDLAAVKQCKNAPYDNTNLDTWNPAGNTDDFPRLYSVLAGAKPFCTQDVNKIYSITYSQTKTMELKWSNLQKLEDETFMKIIMGAAPLDSFDSFVANWKAQGGDEITPEVQQIADGQ